LIVAINHPYLFPYAGYFRLMRHADVFVALDSAQFPRRGFVHRNKLLDVNGVPRWLTIPLRKQSRDVLIKDLEYAGDARELLKKQIYRFPALSNPYNGVSAWANRFLDLAESPVEFILSGLRWVNTQLDISTPIVRSSELGIDSSLRGQDRILAILSHYGASEYVNAPGGRDLYDGDEFRRRNIQLRFLRHYEGDHSSILQLLANRSVDSVVQELESQILWQT
jgi:hypothetical protein